MGISAVIFDLDGVLVSTDEQHYIAWKRLADEESIPFDREANLAFRGVSRADCVDILVARSGRAYSGDEKAELAERKNRYYVGSLESIGPGSVLPGVPELLAAIRSSGVRTAIGSSSKNARLILDRIALVGSFDAIVDGTMISKSKPDPEVFLLAARLLGAEPSACAVIEDSDAGIAAAAAAGMRAVAVGAAIQNPRANVRATGLDRLSLDDLLDR